MQLVQRERAGRLRRNGKNFGTVEDEELPRGFEPSARWNDEVWSGEARTAAGSPGAVLQAGRFGRKRADVPQITRGHRTAACAARRDVAVQDLTVHHGLLALLDTSGSDMNTLNSQNL